MDQVVSNKEGDLGIKREMEHAFLLQEKEAHPELFQTQTFVDDAQALGEFGIWIPEKDQLPLGVLKLWPEDFVVEEITSAGISRITLRNGNIEVGSAETIYATLVKCNLSTLQAIDELAKQLGVSPEAIGYAGLKDKDAITAQRLSFQGVSIERLQKIRSPFFFLKDFELGGEDEQNLRKGSLIANRFSILVRVPPVFFAPQHSEFFSRQIKYISERGFYNFFYLQRFSTPRLRNFVWARLILQGKHREAMLDFLSAEGERELPYFHALRRKIRSSFGQWDKIARLIEPYPIILRHEQKMVGYLIDHPEDYLGAFQSSPEQLTIWVYALASLLFNQKISDALIAGHEPPEELPFFLSRNKNDVELYNDMLRQIGLYPFPFKALQQFPYIRTTPRRTQTRSEIVLRHAEIIKEGLALEFDLAKGQYATTFLAHLFNLAHGAVPQNIKKTHVDSKQIFGEQPISPLLDIFAPIVTEEAQSLQRLLGES